MSIPNIYEADLIYQDEVDTIPDPISNPDSIKPVSDFIPDTIDVLSSPLQSQYAEVPHSAIYDYLVFQNEVFDRSTGEDYVLYGCNVTKVNNNVVNISRGAVVVPNVGVVPVTGGNFTLTGYETYTGLLHIDIDANFQIVVSTAFSNLKAHLATLYKSAGTITQIHQNIKRHLSRLGHDTNTHTFVLGEDRLSCNALLGEKTRQHTGPFIIGESFISSSCYLANPGTNLGDLPDE